MATIYTYPAPEVAAAMEATADCEVKIMASILGFMGLCCILLGVFFLFHFCKPVKQADTESAIELRIVNREDEKKWWIDDYVGES
ncbi:hypothetical protein F4677DRAFT_438576 [Hypoxylon crocopeplum]|nr:hypothetical protein F4677DRAFT_438576 [Hypoxylon crocopeplum]